MNDREAEVAAAWLTFADLIVDIGISAAVFYEQMQKMPDEANIDDDVPVMASELRGAWQRIQIAESKLRELQ
jgi:hypothetical protein